ncbi:MAG: hypothetical protein DIU52_014505 [bacterium]|jgi:uncharacterized membrane protein
MNAAQIHLMLNHVPVIGVIIATLLLAVGLVMRSRDVLRVSLGLLVLVALSGVVVYLTGEPVEHMVRRLPGVEHDTMEAHEEFSFLATVVLTIVGLVSLVGLIRYRRAQGVPRGFAVLTLVLAIIACGMMGWTAHLGGLIRHEELRGTAALQQAP